MKEPNSAASVPPVPEVELPPEWRASEAFDLRVAWLSRTPNRGGRAAELLREALADAGEPAEEGERLAPWPGVSGRPGWYWHFSVAYEEHLSLDAALAAARRVLKNSDFRAARELVANLGLALPGEPAPAHAVKAQRLALIEALSRPPGPEGAAGGWEREAFLEVAGGFALRATIERLPGLRDQIETGFEDPANPARSLHGRRCSVVFAAFDGDDGAEVATGVARVEGNRVTVGEWSHEFPPGALVEGVPFEHASVEDEAAGGWYDLELLDDEPPGGGPDAAAGEPG